MLSQCLTTIIGRNVFQLSNQGETDTVNFTLVAWRPPPAEWRKQGKVMECSLLQMLLRKFSKTDISKRPLDLMTPLLSKCQHPRWNCFRGYGWPREGGGACQGAFSWVPFSPHLALLSHRVTCMVKELKWTPRMLGGGVWSCVCELQW